MVDGNGKVVLLKFENLRVVASYIKEFQGVNCGIDILFEVLVLIKIKWKSCIIKYEMYINFVLFVVFVRFKLKYRNVQLDSDNF